MDIRNAVVEDVEAVSRVYLDSVLAAYAGIATEDYLAVRNLSKCISQWSYNISDDESVTVVVADSEGVIEGVASFSRARDADVDVATTAEIQAIYVSPECWGNGIGRQLCEHAMVRLYSSGFTSILLWSLSDNVRATRFYEQAGFTPDGTSKTVAMGRELSATRYKHAPGFFNIRT